MLDLKFFKVNGINLFRKHVLDPCACRPLAAPFQKFFYIRLVTLYNHFNVPLAGIAYPAKEAQLQRHLFSGCSEKDTLDFSVNGNMERGHGIKIHFRTEFERFISVARRSIQIIILIFIEAKKRPMSKRVLSIISLVFVMFVWGSSFSVTKVAVRELPPIYFAFLRFAVAALLMIVLLIVNRKKLDFKAPLKSVAYMGLTGITFFYIFFNYSLRYTSASTGAMLEGFIPVNIAIFAAVFLREKTSPRQLTGIIISVAGVLLVGLAARPDQHASNPLLGNGLMIVCIILWSVYTIISKRTAAINPLVITTYISVIGALAILPFVFIELNGQPFPMPSPRGWMAIIYLGSIASALCYYLYNKALEQLSATQVGIFLNLDPVVGAVLAVAFLNEMIGFLQITGCALVLTGVWLSAAAKQPAEAIT